MLGLHSVHRHSHIGSRPELVRAIAISSQETENPTRSNLVKALLDSTHLPAPPPDAARSSAEERGKDVTGRNEEKAEGPDNTLGDEATGDEITCGRGC